MQEQNQYSLQNGTILNHYKIIRVLGAGGFGITYLAEDIQLGMEVVLKEYFPNEFAIRNGDSTIMSKTASDRDFTKGMQRFKEEAQVLAKFNHPSIVKILGFFEANNTAYFVMEYEDGIDLSHYLKQLNRPMTQEEILSIIMPILEGLKEVHKHNYLHRDIKPGNILLRKNHSPVLIDFGASKLAIGEASKSITSMLTEGYAPLEQYSTDIKQQGPFTDLYAIGAVVYKMITRKVPPSAQTRSYALLQDDTDPYEFLMNIRPSGFDDNFLMSVDKVLSVKAKDRQQDVSAFQADITSKETSKEQFKETNEPMYETVHEPSGLGGWLALLGFGLIISPFILLAQIVQNNKPIFEDGVWQALTTPASGVYIASFANIAIFEFVDQSFIVLLSFYLIYLYFTKKESFPKWYIWGSIVGILFLIIDAVLAKSIFPETQIFDRDTIRVVISSVIWITYVHVSKQVKNTFIVSDKKSSKPLYIMGVLSFIITGVLFVYLESQPESDLALNSLIDATKVEKDQIVKENIENQSKPKKSKKIDNVKQLIDLGYKYWNGRDVKKDETKAFNYFLKAANLGDTEAETNVGLMYKYGWGVKEDYVEAKPWLEKASNSEDATAQLELGEIYQSGVGISKDLYKAYTFYKKSAEQGNARAQNALANMYANGSGTQKDLKEAVKWYKKSADAGNAWGQNNLAGYYEYGVEVNKDLYKAFSLYKKSAAQDNDTAQYSLAQMYENGEGTIANSKEAMKWYEKSAINGNNQAQMTLGVKYELGLNGIEKNIAKAKKFYEDAAKNNNSYAEFGLGRIYQDKKEYSTAAKWYRKAAKQGNNLAQNALGLLYESGKGVEKDLYKSFDYYKKSAEQGNKYAQRNLGYMYLNGKGTIKSPKKAYDIFIKHARDGNLRSMNQVGYMYEKGTGTSKSSKKALHWYKKSAGTGNTLGELNLGYMYLGGKGVKKSPANAIKWWKKSAQKGNDLAQYNVGYLYYYGDNGIKKSKKKAAYWMKKAYDNGNEDAKKKWNEWKLWKYE